MSFNQAHAALTPMFAKNYDERGDGREEMRERSRQGEKEKKGGKGRGGGRGSPGPQNTLFLHSDGRVKGGGGVTTLLPGGQESRRSHGTQRQDGTRRPQTHDSGSTNTHITRADYTEKNTRRVGPSNTRARTQIKH